LLVFQATRRGRVHETLKCILGMGLGIFISYNFSLAYENFLEVNAELTEEQKNALVESQFIRILYLAAKVVNTGLCTFICCVPCAIAFVIYQVSQMERRR
jgi:hypothetical protein